MGPDDPADKMALEIMGVSLDVRKEDDDLVRVVMKGYKGNGVMVAMPIPPAVAAQLGPRQTPPDAMHVTLAYLGKVDVVSPDAVQKALEITRDVAGSFRPMKANLGGYGRFMASESSDGKDVLYASYDAPMLNDFRQALLQEFRASGIPLKGLAHGFTPHVTTDYLDRGQQIDPPTIPSEVFDATMVCLYVGDMRIEIPFGEALQDDAEEEDDALQPADVQALKMMNLTLVAKEDKAPARAVIVAKSADGMEQLVYAVVLEPDMVDADDQTMTPDDVKFAAHYYMTVKGILGYRHMQTAPADVVESYLAPCDFVLGEQLIKKGSWVLVTRVNDDQLWQQIVNGEINGYSVGGFGVEVDPVTGLPLAS
jgi:2'-5' RNA ligase